MFLLKSVIYILLINTLFFLSPITGQTNVYKIGEVEKNIEPGDNESVLYNEVVLSWEDYSVQNVFQVQISDDKNFNNIVLDTFIHDNHFFTNILENYREYFWRIRDASPECEPYTFVDYNFFKTTNIVINDGNGDNPIKIFPTHINGKEVLYFDNPDYLNYDIKITCLSSKSEYHQKCSADRKGITTTSWPRGTYQIVISSTESLTQTREIVLH